MAGAIVFDKPAVVDPHGIGALGQAMGQGMGQGYEQAKDANTLKAIFEDADMKDALMSDDPREALKVVTKILSSSNLSPQGQKLGLSVAEKAMNKPVQDVEIKSWNKKTGEKNPSIWSSRQQATKKSAEVVANGNVLEEPKKEDVITFRIEDYDEEGNPVPGKKAGKLKKWSWQTPEEFEAGLNKVGLTSRGDDTEKETQTIIVDPKTGDEEVWSGKPGDKIPSGKITKEQYNQMIARREKRQDRKDAADDRAIERKDAREDRKKEREENRKQADEEKAAAAQQKQTEFEDKETEKLKKNEGWEAGQQLPKDTLKQFNRLRTKRGLPPLEEKVEEKDGFFGKKKTYSYGEKDTDEDAGQKPAAKPTGKKDENHDKAVAYLKGAENEDDAKQRIRELNKKGWTKEQLYQMAADAGLRSGQKPAVQAGAKSGYKSADDVKAAYRAGKLTKDKALQILKDDFGME